MYARGQQEDLPCPFLRMVAMDTERKAISSITLDINDNREVEGLAAVVGNVDDVGDVLHPGAFTKTLQESKSRVKHLWQHDANNPPTAIILDLREIKGREGLPGEVKSAFPDATGGLLVKRRYLDTPRGLEIFAGVQSKAISEMSIGYMATKKSYGTVGNVQVRNLHEIRLMETSDVLWGANPATLASKSLIEQAIWAIRAGRELTDLLQAGAMLTPEDIAQMGACMQMLSVLLERAKPEVEGYPEMMSNYLDLLSMSTKVGKMVSSANMEKLRRAIEALQEILNAAEPPAEKALTTRNIATLALARAKLAIMEN